MEENNKYPLWTDLESLKTTDKEREFFALYKLFYCLRVDTFTVDLYLKHLKCVLYSGDICNSVNFYGDPWWTIILQFLIILFFSRYAWV